MSKVPENTKFRAAQMVKMAIFDLLKSAKISLKIKVAGKLLNFHTIEIHSKKSQFGCPGLYTKQISILRVKTVTSLSQLFSTKKL